jgi:K(+)-stimulated pyrophosphate-energized sodium pump
MNLVSLLIAPSVITLSVGDDQNDALRILIAVVAAAGIAIAVYISKRRPIAIGDADTEANQPASTGTA